MFIGFVAIYSNLKLLLSSTTLYIYWLRLATLFWENTSNGGYLGGMVLRPITEQWTVFAFGGGGLGSDDYSNYWIGSGLGYKFNAKHSLNLFGFISDDNFGRISKLGIAYTYEFK